MTANLILGLIGILFIIDSIFVFLFPKRARNLLKVLMKKNNIYALAVTELIVGLIILTIIITIGVA